MKSFCHSRGSGNPTINKCRVCGSDLFDEPLLKYRNMPRAAQNLPDKEAIKAEKGADLTVCQCSGCGLVQLTGEPVPYFREVIRASAFSSDMENFRIRQFADLVDKYSLRGKKVVEIGCGRGEYLSLMQQAGADAYGLEYGEESVKECVRSDLKVSRGFIESAADGAEGAPFDAFFILNFLEHLPDPNSTLKGIWNNLKDGAVGLVEVPNFDMIIKKRVFAEFIADHLFYFTKETLSNTLRYNGFDVVELREIWNDYIISAVVKKVSPSLQTARCKRLDLKDFNEHQSRLGKEINGYVDRFGNGRVAVWGAGHQAFALLSLLDLGKRIKYVVDSADFKQGRYTPATHIPIVAPDTLDTEPVDAIVVMAGGYSDEVARIVREKYSGKIDISVLRDYGLERICHPEQHVVILSE